ncbi:MAG: MBL fold metallo-hydrolase [Alphaproteobacteria bacterium]|nr:MBL fold metallo-hydrolase [Alphaproteobacteria bacterium]
MKRRAFLASVAMTFAVTCLAASPASSQSGVDALKRASDAMGAGQLRSLRYSTEGIGWTHGQAFKPGQAWPKITIHGQTRSINYDSGSMREETTLSRGEPLGGGGYPLAGQQRNDFYLSGASAWNVVGQNTIAGARFVADRTHQLWITPHGVLKAAQRNNTKVTWRKKGNASLATLAFKEAGRLSAKVFLDDKFMVERVESRAPDAVLGEVTVVTRYSDYRDVGGVKMPGRVRQSSAGFPVLDVMVKDVQPNAAVDIAVPDSVRSAAERVASEKVADGVWFVSGGSHNSVAIEMKDHLVLVEAPLNDLRTLPVIEHVRGLVPGKPIRYVINSHQHFDHAGGLRTAAGEGITIVAQSDIAKYLRTAFATRNTIAPDRLAQSGRKASFLPIGKNRMMTDGSRTLQILDIKNSVHSGTFLMVYMPKEKLLIQADAYTPLPPNAPAPNPPNANHVNLVTNIEGQKLAVERILPLHGRVVPLGELYTTASATPKR